jgi:hypothetical protein
LEHIIIVVVNYGAFVHMLEPEPVEQEKELRWSQQLSRTSFRSIIIMQLYLALSLHKLDDTIVALGVIF